jgi:hypothetical protein
MRVLVSDHWRNISPVLERLPHCEVVMIDRTEAVRAGLRNIWRFRMRFMHASSFRSPAGPAQHMDAAKAMQKRWSETKQEGILDSFAYKGIALQGVVEGLFDEIFLGRVPSLLEEVDQFYAMLQGLAPDIVMLRATVSQQLHFALLAFISKHLGIPSFELLHGMEYPGPGSHDSRHLAEYFGVYGKHTQRQMARWGFSEQQLPVIGSPRFDAYAKSKTTRETSAQPKGMTIFCTAPEIFFGATYDSYDIEEYFDMVAGAAKSVPSARVIIKLRAGGNRKTFYTRVIENAFKGVEYSIAEHEALGVLFAQSDVAVSCQSTVTLEAMQCGVPLVLLAATPGEEMMLTFNFKEMTDVGAVVLCHSGQELATALKSLSDSSNRQTMSERASAYLKSEFAFDGRAGERTAALIRSLVTKGRVG